MAFTFSSLGPSAAPAVGKPSAARHALLEILNATRPRRAAACPLSLTTSRRLDPSLPAGLLCLAPVNYPNRRSPMFALALTPKSARSVVDNSSCASKTPPAHTE